MARKMSGYGKALGILAAGHIDFASRVKVKKIVYIEAEGQEDKVEQSITESKSRVIH